MEVRSLIEDDAANARAKRIARLKAAGKPVDSVKSPTEYRIAQCLDMLNAYMGEGTPVDSLRMMSGGWIEGLMTFMTEGDPRLSYATADERRKRFGTYCRTLIRRGLLPNISVFPEKDTEIVPELEKVQQRDRAGDVKRLVSLFYAKLDMLSKKNETKTAALLASETRDIATVLLGVLLGGIGYEAAAALRKSDIRDNRIYLKHLGATVALPAEIKELADVATGCLSVDRNVDKVVANRCMSVLKHVSLDFADGFSEPFVQWLELARAGGVTPAEQQALINLLFADKDTCSAQGVQAVQRAIDCAAKAVECDSKKWYCVKCAGRIAVKEGEEKKTRVRAVNGVRLQKYVNAQDSVLLRTVECYSPYDPVLSDRNGKKEIRNNRLLDELLFFKASRSQADAVNRLLMSKKYGFIFCRRRDNGLQYSEISEQDIERLRSFLDVRDDKRFAVEDYKTAKGTRVRVIAGLYEGYEGEVCAVTVDRKSGSEKPCFVINIPGICAVATYSVDPAYLVRIAD